MSLLTLVLMVASFGTGVAVGTYLCFKANKVQSVTLRNSPPRVLIQHAENNRMLAIELEQ